MARNPPYYTWTIPKLKAMLLEEGIVLHGGEKKATLIKLYESAIAKGRHLKKQDTNSTSFSQVSSSSPATPEVTPPVGGTHSVTLSTEDLALLAKTVATATVEALSPLLRQPATSTTQLPGVQHTALSANANGMQVVSNSGDNESICNDSLLSVRGVPSNSVPLVDIVAPSIKKDIIAGRYVNLASLLISSSNDSAVRELSLGTSSILLKPFTDSPLNRPLTLSEFIVAFNIYKKVMCSAYPQERVVRVFVRYYKTGK